MEENQIKAFIRQLSRVYAIATLQLVISVAGYFCVQVGYSKISSLMFCVMGSLVCVVLVYMQPWKIAQSLIEGRGYKRALSEIAEQKTKRV